jgi:hypothetical protein
LWLDALRLILEALKALAGPWAIRGEIQGLRDGIAELRAGQVKGDRILEALPCRRPLLCPEENFRGPLDC